MPDSASDFLEDNEVGRWWQLQIPSSLHGQTGPIVFFGGGGGFCVVEW